MTTLTSKVTVPIILVGLFSIVVFMAMNYNQLGASFYVILLLLAVYIFSFGFAVGQSLSSPVQKLLKNAEELSKGNLSSRVYLQTKDELSQLADAFNKIAEELEESHIDGEMIEKTADIKARAKTQGLEETISALEQKVRNRTAEFEKIMGESTALQQQLKLKEAEVMQLRKDLDGLAPKMRKPRTKKNARIA